MFVQFRRQNTHSHKFHQSGSLTGAKTHRRVVIKNRWCSGQSVWSKAVINDPTASSCLSSSFLSLSLHHRTHPLTYLLHRFCFIFCLWPPLSSLLLIFLPFSAPPLHPPLPLLMWLSVSFPSTSVASLPLCLLTLPQCESALSIIRPQRQWLSPPGKEQRGVEAKCKAQGKWI